MAKNDASRRKSASGGGQRAGAQTSQTSDEPLGKPAEQLVQMVFPTPIALHHWPDSDALNADLSRLILAKEAASPSGLARSNVGGWHSDMRFMFTPEPAFQRLAARVKTLARELTRAMMAPGDYEFRLEGWANVLRRGQYNSVHVHPNATWSIVYYVTGNPPPPEPTGDGAAEGSPAFSGKIEFLDPRPAAAATYTVESMLQRRCLLSPPPGAMVAFPSWLQHQVHPYFGPEARISVAYNVLVG